MNKTTLFIIIAIVAAIVSAYNLFGKRIKDTWETTNRPDHSLKPTQLVKNEKMIVVRNISLDEIKKVLTQLCNMYNQETYLILPRLTILQDEFVITFPYDISFEYFCYAVNYLYFPFDFAMETYKPEIKAWSTVEKNQEWDTSEINGKMAMIYIPKWDEEHDNVYLTTEFNVGYKLPFAITETMKKLDKPADSFEVNPIKEEDLDGKETVDFE